MKTLVISIMTGGLFLLTVLAPSHVFAQTNTKVEVGSKVPDFKLPDQNGKLFDIRSVLGKKNLVIYFYPKDGTSGCTKEACSFRDQLDGFKQKDAEVIGISGDGVASHKAFAEQHHLNFTILADEGNKVRQLFGVPQSILGTVPGRVSYVINKKGIVVHIYNSLTQPVQHVREALTTLQTMNH